MGQCYRARFPLILISTNQEINVGDIVDLSDKPDSQIKDMIRMGLIETAEGDPVNVAGPAPEGQKKRR